MSGDLKLRDRDEAPVSGRRYCWIERKQLPERKVRKMKKQRTEKCAQKTNHERVGWWYSW
ncbi:hypothetical protein K461DRAFT_275236 [Myriangium duriaei CBS 260.36]|uniref:Uncharacterized protein n=1 Tax=Myriangium duriaei CBS 260.36 TaxID=1168546 RepID=A0A9P4JBV5_9PEZI|nr:hypothetical protein K461DRAFT_275236 [Myriangium duriaei CBS 260.36]